MTAAEWARCLARLVEGWPNPPWDRARIEPYTTSLERMASRDVHRAITTCIERIAKLADPRHGRFAPQPAELVSLARVYEAQRLQDERTSERMDQYRREALAIESGVQRIVPFWVIRATVERMRGGRVMFESGPDPRHWPAGWCDHVEGRLSCCLPADHEGQHDLKA